ncbi:hypothetical protein EIN_485680 [Entamoeba invadens IP1]|uniref:Uncharacterized protein n=1 Tax=Entamoeba invadens IP1 TaxID=370355 RepID=A0A0A1U4J7_ENTIV|nr:hypothetical protein EIN_485680 [Entamoeba invadens IP1]ELP89176.1 hypothetical protein EIN_485680 [Entamoeba invadens IP1]|eukprot:XP_004255947.1 hypothetical protein EIN_485680 [Entamoeba invadens IP1]
MYYMLQRRYINEIIQYTPQETLETLTRVSRRFGEAPNTLTKLNCLSGKEWNTSHFMLSAVDHLTIVKYREFLKNKPNKHITSLTFYALELYTTNELLMVCVPQNIVKLILHYNESVAPILLNDLRFFTALKYLAINKYEEETQYSNTTLVKTLRTFRTKEKAAQFIGQCYKLKDVETRHNDLLENLEALKSVITFRLHMDQMMFKEERKYSFLFIKRMSKLKELIISDDLIQGGYFMFDTSVLDSISNNVQVTLNLEHVVVPFNSYVDINTDYYTLFIQKQCTVLLLNNKNINKKSILQNTVKAVVQGNNTNDAISSERRGEEGKKKSIFIKQVEVCRSEVSCLTTLLSNVECEEMKFFRCKVDKNIEQTIFESLRCVSFKRVCCVDMSLLEHITQLTEMRFDEVGKVKHRKFLGNLHLLSLVVHNTGNLFIDNISRIKTLKNLEYDQRDVKCMSIFGKEFVRHKGEFVTYQHFLLSLDNCKFESVHIRFKHQAVDNPFYYFKR